MTTISIELDRLAKLGNDLADTMYSARLVLALLVGEQPDQAEEDKLQGSDPGFIGALECHISTLQSLNWQTHAYLRRITDALVAGVECETSSPDAPYMQKVRQVDAEQLAKVKADRYASGKR